MSTVTLDRQTEPDVTALTHLLRETAGVPELFEEHLTGESPEQAAARQAAAADITDVILADHPHGVRTGIEDLAALTAVYTELITRQARERVASWIPGEGAAA